MTDIQHCLKLATKQLSETSDSAQLDAEVLLCHVLNKDRAHLRAWPEKPLSEKQSTEFNHLVERRKSGQPVAYLLEHKEFWSREFTVCPDVLIPRPDTELLIELSLEWLKNKPSPRIIDLGTGSGIIAITLAAERNDAEVYATDLSLQALNIAKQNADRHHTGKIQFIHSDWFKALNSCNFDLIISNPPYIDEKDPHLTEGDVRFEPDSALIAADKGLLDIQSICANARNYLKANGSLMIEHGYQQKSAVEKIFQQYHYQHIQTHYDLAGHPRVTAAQGYLS